jgi:hypothetical protein
MNIRRHHPSRLLRSLPRRGLLLGPSTVPIDDVDQLPGIFAEFELKLTLFVDDQLGSRVEVGPVACVLKCSGGLELLQAIEQILHGRPY